MTDALAGSSGAVMASWRGLTRATGAFARLLVRGPPGDDATRQRVVWDLYEGFVGQFPDVVAVRPEDLLAAQGDGANWVVVDVRADAERAVSTLPGAISVEDLRRAASSFAGRRVVVYCTLGYRSARVARALAAEGWQVANLAGGVLAWTHAGASLVQRGVTVDALHVYGSSYNVAASWVRAVW